MPQPLVNRICVLQKFSGKGGWTYAELPEVPVNKQNPFGWVKVCGNIDNYAIAQYHLMPMGNGHLFLPVKAAIRKQIGKQAGDSVNVVLYLDESAMHIPQDFADSLTLDSDAANFFYSLSEGEQKKWLDWMFASQKQAIERMAIAMEQLVQHVAFATFIARQKNTTR